MLTLMLLRHDRKNTFLNVNKNYRRGRQTIRDVFSSHRLLMVLIGQGVWENIIYVHFIVQCVKQLKLISSNTMNSYRTAVNSDWATMTLVLRSYSRDWKHLKTVNIYFWLSTIVFEVVWVLVIKITCSCQYISCVSVAQLAFPHVAGCKLCSVRIPWKHTLTLLLRAQKIV